MAVECGRIHINREGRRGGGRRGGGGRERERTRKSIDHFLMYLSGRAESGVRMSMCVCVCVCVCVCMCV